MLALLLLAAGGAWGAREAPSEKGLQELRGRIERLQQRLAEAEKSSGEAADQLRESSRALTEAHRALFELAGERRALEQELEAIVQRQRAARAGAAEQEALAARLLRLQQRQGTPDRLRLALEGRDAATVARHIAYYGYIQRARAELIGQLRRKGEELAGLEREARERRDALAANEAAQAAEARQLQKQRAVRATLVAKIGAELERGRREIGRLKRDEARLARLVEEIAKALTARETSRVPKKGRPVEGVADESVASRPFDALKGRLKLPVRGDVTNRYGAPREAGQWKGLFIRSPTGETVRAVADGRVVYADWLRGFGNLLILDHGKGFMSLYGNNEGLLRKVGEKVRGGDPIAHVGQADERADSGLYFELRREGKTFDPMSWVAQ